MIFTIKRQLKIQRYYAIIVALLAMVPIIGGLPGWVTSSIYISYMLCVIYYGIYRNRIEIVPLFFILYLPISLYLSNPIPIFRSWERLMAFMMLFIVASPLIQSVVARNLRRQTLTWILRFSVIISVICFFCYFLDINLFEDDYRETYYDDYEEFIGHFSGITRHSMLLGPISSIATLYLIDEVRKHRRYILLPLIVMTIGTLLFAASRLSIVAAIAGVVLTLLMKYGARMRIVKYALITCVVATMIYPWTKQYIKPVINKHENVETGVYDTRTEKIEFRFSEFKKSPIVGIGFASIDPDGQDDYDLVTGTIEPGSSWLAILSMTGIVGMILFIGIIVYSYYTIKFTDSYLLPSLLFFFIVHMMAEGYVFSSGNTIGFILWLVIGNCYDSRWNKETKELLSAV